MMIEIEMVSERRMVGLVWVMVAEVIVVMVGVSFGNGMGDVDFHWIWDFLFDLVRYLEIFIEM